MAKSAVLLFLQLDIFRVSDPAVRIPAYYFLPNCFCTPADEPKPTWNAMDQLNNSVPTLDKSGELLSGDTAGKSKVRILIVDAAKCISFTRSNDYAVPDFCFYQVFGFGSGLAGRLEMFYL